jgi:NADPH:quinone reductase-like Zn-dependent oxidoreductase
MCVPLKQRLSIEQASSMIVNPLTAMGLLDTARRAGHRAAAQTAGASQLERMLLAMATEVDYPLIHNVRRDAQFDLLRSPGAEHVLNSSDDDFANQFRSGCCLLDATAAFEAVAGDMSGTVINLMPPGSTAFVDSHLYDARKKVPAKTGRSVTGFRNAIVRAMWASTDDARSTAAGARRSTPREASDTTLRFDGLSGSAEGACMTRG